MTLTYSLFVCFFIPFPPSFLPSFLHSFTFLFPLFLSFSFSIFPLYSIYLLYSFPFSLIILFSSIPSISSVLFTLSLHLFVASFYIIILFFIHLPVSISTFLLSIYYPILLNFFHSLQPFHIQNSTFSIPLSHPPSSTFDPILNFFPPFSSTVSPLSY